MKVRLAKERGFTLIEIVVVATIIFLLIGIVSVSLQAVRLKTQAAQGLADLQKIALSLEKYKANYGAYPLSCGTGGQWASYNSSFGCNLGPCWIPQFSGEGWCPLPRNMNLPPVGVAANQSQYIYITDGAGANYKLIYHQPVSMAVPPQFFDPQRMTFAFGFWSSGGAGF